NYHQNNTTFYPNQQHNGYFIENIIGHSLKNGYNNQQCQCSHSSYDPQSNVYYHAKSNIQQHIPPPASTNMQLINSPARSIRRSRSNDSDDEGFQTVTNKKSKHQNNYNDRPQTSQQQQENVNSTNNNIMTMNAPHPIIMNSNNHQQNLKDHHCSSDPKCKHCNGDHAANSTKCPVVKSFRPELTRNLLNNNNNRASSYSSTVNNNNSYQYNASDFPHMPTRWLPSNGSMISKLDELITGMSKVNEILEKMSETNKIFEQFIIDKNEHDMKVINEIEHLKSNDRKLEKDLALFNAKNISHDNLIKQQDEMLKKLL
ncbi:unnamed protein product, partial [Didymodactylos carnosus]